MAISGLTAAATNHTGQATLLRRSTIDKCDAAGSVGQIEEPIGESVAARRRCPTRDDAMIALLIGCGLRRVELLGVRLESIEHPRCTGSLQIWWRRAGHVRTVPIPTWVKMAVDVWAAAVAITDDPIFARSPKVGASTATACHSGGPGMLSVPRRVARISAIWHHTTCRARAHGCAAFAAGTRSGPAPARPRVDPDDGALPRM